MPSAVATFKQTQKLTFTVVKFLLISGPLLESSMTLDHDTYVIVPAANSDTSASKLNHVQTWAEENNLKLNCSKSKKIIFTGRGTRIKPVIIPPPCGRASTSAKSVCSEKASPKRIFLYRKNTTSKTEKIIAARH